MTLLVLGSGGPDYRRDLLEAVVEHRPVLVAELPATWELDVVAAAVTVRGLAAARLGHVSDALLDRLAEVAVTHEATGVLTFDEQLVECTALLARRLGLPGLDPGAAAACRDKARTRRLLRAAGLPQPRVTVVAPDAAGVDDIRLPAVVKPSTLAGSVGVRLVHDAVELTDAVARARLDAGAAATGPAFAVLVEELVDGPEISVDSVVVDGVCTVVQIARKQLTTDGRFVETGHVVDARDPLWGNEEVRDTVLRAHAAVGFDHGCSHTELRLSEHGPVVIEINARVAGDFLPRLAELAGAEHLASLAARVATGMPVVPTAPVRAAAVAFGTGAVSTTVPSLAPGEHVELPSTTSTTAGRTAIVLAVADDGARAAALCATALGRPAPSSDGHVTPVPAPEDPAGLFWDLAGDGWRAWRGVVLRGAGFPVDVVTAMGDATLAREADRAVADGRGVAPRPGSAAATAFTRTFDASAHRLGRRIGDLARTPSVREAVLWQNPGLLDALLDRYAPEQRGTSRHRKRETVIASYLQRYATKNESIGFFGPVGWASWGRGADTRLDVGAGLVRGRRVYFENWAVDAFRDRVVRDPEIRPQLAPRLDPSTYVDEGRAHRAVGRPVDLTAEQLALVGLVDGDRTIETIARRLGKTAPDVDELLRELEELRVVRVDLGGPIEAYPERHLAGRLDRLTGPPATELRRDLRRLVAARDRVGAAAGDTDALAIALAELAETFEEVTGRESSRMHGKTYAGRCVVYEDTRRSAGLTLGTDVAQALAGPLALVLQAGRWLTCRLATGYAQRFEELWDRRVARTGDDEVPLSRLLALAARDFYTGDGLPPIARGAADELADRWATLLAVDEHARSVSFDVDELAPRVAEAFSAPPPRWTAARHHSPDVMIAAEDVAAIDRGDFLLVLGELHLAFNTVESRALVEQHDDPGVLLRMSQEAVGGPRFVPAAPREWGSTTSRTSPPTALVSPHDTFWSVGPDDDAHLPGGSVPVAALVVRRTGAGLVVAHRSGAVLADLVEFLGEHLSGVAVNAFALLPARRHTPRVTVGRLVVARETWRVPARECDWSRQMDEAVRFLQMRAWRSRLGLPERAFYKVPGETKPSFVDFSSPALVNLLASHVRGLGTDQTVTLSEMLPDLHQTWLVDDAGRRYTSELRMVVSDTTR